MMRIIALMPMMVGTALALSAAVAMAAERYDGTWVIESPQTTTGANVQNPQGCEPVRLELQVKDNEITGTLKREVLGRARVENAPRGAPVTGKVEPDGTINAQWENYVATGKLTGDSGQVRWTGECGPRVATAKRVAPAEETGSTTHPK